MFHQLKSQKISWHVVNPTATCILTVAGGQKAACLATLTEVGQDCLAMNRDCISDSILLQAETQSSLPQSSTVPQVLWSASDVSPPNPPGGINQLFKGI